MSDKKENYDIEKVDGALEVEVIENEGLLIEFSKPYFFEGVEYKEIDLSGLEGLSAADMLAINKRLERTSGVSVMPEVSLEYALNLAARAAAQPIEFFTALPVKEAIKVKNRVMGFLFA